MVHTKTEWTRVMIRFFGALSALWLLIGAVYAAPGDFVVARVKYSGGGDWYSDRTSIPNWLKALNQRTDIRAARDQEVIRLTDRNLYQYPLIYMTGHGNIRFTEAEIAALRTYLTNGGFLYVDDNYGLDKSFRREMARVFPEKSFQLLPNSHPIYHSFYDLAGLPKIHEHDGEPAQGFALFHEGRVIVYYTYSSDIGDGLEDPEVHNDPPDVRERAIQMAVNIAVYVLTH